VRLVLLGDPVAHSLSPRLHEAALRVLGIPGSYTARRVDAGGLQEAFIELRNGRLDGANVTMPHKAAAFVACDRVSAVARQVGAVNTLVPEGGLVRGENTDVEGIRRAWRWGGLPEDAPVLVLGAGGAAAAAVVGRPAGVEVLVSARRTARAGDLLARLHVEGTVVPWGEPVPGAVVVNATPVGMDGTSRLPEAVLAAAEGLFDMAYGHGPTPATTTLRARGRPVVPGTEMLLAQAAASIRIWTGREAPQEAMRAALTTP